MEWMMVLVTLIFLVLASGFAVLFKRLTSHDRTNMPLPLDDWEGIFSPSRYKAMERLLEGTDQNFLRSHPGVSPGMERKLRRTRVKLFRSYMHQLSDDFHRICKALKILMIHSPVERNDLAGLILKQQFRFTVTMLNTEARLTLYSLGWSDVNTNALLEPLTAVRTQLQALAAVANPALGASQA
jgi:hypothetical protein